MPQPEAARSEPEQDEMDVNVMLEAVVLVAAIVMGTRAGGVGVGLWDGHGTFVFVFDEAPG